MYEQEFPLDPAVHHLNHAAVAPWPARTRSAVQAFAEENARQGSRQYDRWLAVERSLRARLQRLINAPSSSEIALLKSTSEGLSVVAHGLPWKSGDRVVITNLEFPSNRIVWQSLGHRGVRVREVDIVAAPDAEQALIDALDERTRVLAVSSVQYNVGLRLDLQRLGEACRDHGALFCVDAIQSIGALPFDAQAVQADFVVADGHKWMLGPEGLALFYCRNDRLEELELHQYGWHMVANRGEFDRKDWAPAADATRFECGSPNFLGIHALEASLSLLEEVGLEAVERAIASRAERILDYLLDRPTQFEILTPLDPRRRGGIVTFRPLNEEPDSLYRRLQEAGVLCALRGGGIRFSPHFYTTDATLEHALNLLY